MFLCIILNKYYHLQYLSLVNDVIGLWGFLSCLLSDPIQLPFAINNLLFIMAFGKIFLNIYPSEGFVCLFFLKTSGSRIARNLTNLTPPIFVILTIILFVLDDFNVLSLNSGFLLVSSSVAIIIIVSMILLVNELTKSDISKNVATKETKDTKIFYEKLINNMEDGVLVTNAVDEIIYSNHSILEYFQKEEDELIGKNLLKNEFLFELNDYYLKAIKYRKPVFVDSLKIKRKNDSIFLTGWLSPEFNFSNANDINTNDINTNDIGANYDGLDNNFKGMVLTLMDNSETKEKESILKASVDEKNILLSEIHHRVKNNMQIIASLLNIKSLKIDNEEAKEVIFECQQRIKTMALVHENLYQNLDFSSINIEEYLRLLISQIKNSYIIHDNINFDLNVIDSFFEIDVIIPLGLIANELITNSVKYAFPDNENGLITINLSKKDGFYYFLVKDNGVGMSNNDVNGGGIGIRLVDTLTNQLEGTYEFDGSNGTSVIIKFK